MEYDEEKDDVYKLVLTKKKSIMEFMFLVNINQAATNTLIVQFLDRNYETFSMIEPLLKAIGWEDVTDNDEMKIVIEKSDYSVTVNQRIFRKIGPLRDVI